MNHMAMAGEHISLSFGNNTASLSWPSGGHFVCLMTAILVYSLSKIMFASHKGVYENPTCSQGKLEKKSKTNSLSKHFCTAVLYKVWPSHTKLFTLDIHRRIFRRLKSKMADYLTEKT